MDLAISFFISIRIYFTFISGDIYYPEKDNISRLYKMGIWICIHFTFWIISIYIFNVELYNTNDFLIIGSICISLTIVSSMIMTYTFMDKERDEIMLDQDVIIPSLAIQIILLSVIIFLGYLFKKITGYYFEYYSFLIFDDESLQYPIRFFENHSELK